MDRREKENLIEKMLDESGKAYRKFVADKGPHSCAQCRAYDGQIFLPDETPPHLPLHPNCKCQLEIIRHIVIPKTFKGFEKDRFQEHDKMIAALVADFNAHKTEYAGCTPDQAGGIPDMPPELFKSFLIQESGGNSAAWQKDPAQVNVSSKDWTKEKELIGLKKPEKCNEGELKTNMAAALKHLVRKGFGKSGQPAQNRPSGFFDGWKEAFKRYNTHKEITPSGNIYCVEYADKIIKRAENPNKEEPIEMTKRKK